MQVETKIEKFFNEDVGEWHFKVMFKDNLIQVYFGDEYEITWRSAKPSFNTRREAEAYIKRYNDGFKED